MMDRYKIVGHISLARQVKPSFARTGDTPWHASCFNEFGLWGFNLHGFGLRLDVIGPFGLRRITRKDCTLSQLDRLAVKGITL